MHAAWLQHCTNLQGRRASLQYSPNDLCTSSDSAPLILHCFFTVRLSFWIVPLFAGEMLAPSHITLATQNHMPFVKLAFQETCPGQMLLVSRGWRNECL